jgi:outer membrane protein
MRFAIPLLVAAMFAVPQQADGQAATLTLDQAVSLARRNNPVFQATVNARRAADLSVKAAYANLLPSLSASASGRFTEGGQQFINGIPISNSSDIIQSNYGFGLGYTINSAILFAPRLFAAQRDAAEADVTGATEILRSTVTQQYLAVLRAQATADLQDTLLVTTKGLLELARARHAVGAATILDVRTAEVALGRAEVAALQARNAAEVQMLRLFEQLGVPQPPNVELVTRFPVAEVQFSLDSLKRLARAANPGLVALKSRETAAVAGVRAQRGQYLPSLSLSTGWGWNGSRFTNTDALVERAQIGQIANFGECSTLDSLRTGAGMSGLNCSSLFPTPLPQSQIDAIRAANSSLDFTKAPQSFSAFISIPIFDNLNREQRLQQAHIDRDNARFAVKGREVRLDADVTEAYLNLVTASRTVELNDLNAGAAREQLAFAEERYRVGAATFLDVTTARGDFERAQIDRLNAVYEYHRAFAALESAVGRPLR